MAEEEIKLVAYTPELQQAVNKVLGLDRGVRYPRGGKRNTLTETVAAGSYEYNGYFKITDASEGDAFKVKVADGATGGASTCKVNNKVFSVPAWTSEAITASKVVALKYTAASGDAAASVAVELFDELPDDSDTAAYCQIGRVIISSEGRTIQQDHTTGVAQIWWYLLCSEVVQ